MSNEELVIRIKAGVDVADNMLQLWEQTKSFIHMAARQYQGYAELEDLEQEGYIALYDAVDGYSQEAGCKFLSYASFWIKQRMKRYIENCCMPVRIPAQGNLIPHGQAPQSELPCACSVANCYRGGCVWQLCFQGS